MELGEIRGRAIFIAGVTGVGKNTLISRMQERFSKDLRFACSTTSRSQRSTESEGKNYYFVTPEEFLQRIKDNKFLEYEVVHGDIMYGTERAEYRRIWQQEFVAIADIDVKGAINFKKSLGVDALTVFITVSKLDDLRTRLRARGQEDEAMINLRLSRAELEMSFQDQFDAVVMNDNLEQATQDLENVIREFLV